MKKDLEIPDMQTVLYMDNFKMKKKRIDLDASDHFMTFAAAIVYLSGNESILIWRKYSHIDMVLRSINSQIFIETKSLSGKIISFIYKEQLQLAIPESSYFIRE